MGITLNIASRNEHVPEIERYIRVVKERVRAIASVLPFKQYPPRLIAEMVYNVVFWLNTFPHNDGVHTNTYYWARNRLPQALQAGLWYIRAGTRRGR